MNRDYGELNTFPKILRNNAEVFFGQTFVLEKRNTGYGKLCLGVFFIKGKKF